MPRKVFIAGEILTAADTNEFLVNEGFQIRETLYFESSGQFVKADFPFLRAIRVKCQGAGGGSGGAGTSGRSSGGGGAGGYGEKFVTDITGLSASETVTVGGGGSAGAAADGAGGSGGSSSALGLTGNGGAGGFASDGPFSFALGGSTSGADFSVVGGRGTPRIGNLPTGIAAGASSFLSNPTAGVMQASNTAGNAGLLYGGGGGAAVNSTVDQSGGAGANGIVIVELFA